MFLPPTAELDGHDILMDHPRLVVLGAPFEVVFVMKMYRAALLSVCAVAQSRGLDPSPGTKARLDPPRSTPSSAARS